LKVLGEHQKIRKEIMRLKSAFSRDQFKALPPEDTIQKIRTILHEKDLFVIESNWFRESNYFSSVGLTISNAPISSAGKGINAQYALASSYAEFMERLQNLIILEKNYAGRQPIKKVNFPDGIPFNYNQFKSEHYPILKGFFDEEDLSQVDIFLTNWQNIHSYAYYDVTKDEITYLPYELLLLCVGSNGMCAGNTPEEALIQGLCEIFERFVLKEIYRNKDLILPLVPEEFFKNSALFPYFDLLKQNGYEVYAKDCSLGGKLPVAGVLIKKGNKAQFSLGASPDFFIAMERCFTELFQGYQLDSIDNKLRPVVSLDTPISSRNFTTSDKRIRHQFFKSLTRGEGIVNPLVFNNSRQFNPDNIFYSDSLISKQTLNKLIKIVRKLNYQIFIRDVSFLGFPSYQLYVPDMSETTKITYDTMVLHLRGIPIARKIFFNLEKSTPKELLFLAKTIEALLDFPYMEKKVLLKSIHNLSLKSKAILNHIDPESLLHMLYYRVGDVKASYAIFKKYLVYLLSPEQLQNPPPHVQNHICLLRLLEYMAEKDYSLEDARKKVGKEIEPGIVEEVYPLLHNPSQMPKYLGIPQCDDCSCCDYQQICDYEEIRKFAEKVQTLVQKYPLNQRNVKKIFS